jgi:hypothetical protein
MQLDPAIGGGVVAGDGIPDRRRRPAFGRKRRGKPERGEPPINAHGRPGPGLRADELGNRKRRRANRGDREVADREHRRQVAVAAERNRRVPPLVAADGTPDGGKKTGSRSSRHNV